MVYIKKHWYIRRSWKQKLNGSEEYSEGSSKDTSEGTLKDISKDTSEAFKELSH